MGTFGRFRGTFVLLAGESYPWLRELGEEISSKDDGILHDAYSQQSFVFSPNILISEITCDRKHAVWR